MARGKPQKTDMTIEINSNIKYVIYANILTRQDKRPTSSKRSMKSVVEHLTQRNIPQLVLKNQEMQAYNNNI
jgi:hypothetical protein